MSFAGIRDAVNINIVGARINKTARMRNVQINMFIIKD
jgi:hypothetical protein